MSLSVYEKVSGAWASRAYYHKEGGVWVTRPGQVYRKASGVWSPLLPPWSTVGSYNLNDYKVQPSNATAHFTLQTDGQIALADPSTTYADWVDDKASARFASSLYEVYVSENAGSPDPASVLTYNAGLDTWLPLSSSRKYGLLQITVGGEIVWLDVTIREIAAPTNTSTGLLKLNVFKESGA